MFCQKHRLKIASLRIGKHRIVKKTEHRPPLLIGDLVKARKGQLRLYGDQHDNWGHNMYK